MCNRPSREMTLEAPHPLSDLTPNLRPLNFPRAWIATWPSWRATSSRMVGLVARWLRSPARFRDKPTMQIAGNHEYYESLLDQEEAAMRHQAEEQGVHFLDRGRGRDRRRAVSRLHAMDRLSPAPSTTPVLLGQPVRLLSDRYRAMTESASLPWPTTPPIRVDDPHTSNSRGTRRLVPMDALQVHWRDRS